MAVFLFAKAIIEGAPIKLFNHGKMRRDFTYIDDVARVVLRLIDHVPQGSEGEGGSAPARIYNVAIITRNSSCMLSRCWRKNWAARR